jgi:hypothetical protein
MINKAIKKIKEEISKENIPYVKVIGEFLLQYLESNPEAAVKIINTEKTIIKSLTEMQKEARKKKSVNCAILTDQEGFEIVLKYFDIDGKVKNNAPVTKVTEERVVQEKDKSSIDFDVSLDDLI